jgi:hypothetical protein
MWSENEYGTEKMREVWGRALDPQGAVRCSILDYRGMKPMDFARRRTEGLRGQADVDSIEIKETSNRLQVAWRQLTRESGRSHVTASRAFIIANQEGVLLITYSYDASREQTLAVQKEIGEAQSIANRSAPVSGTTGGRQPIA